MLLIIENKLHNVKPLQGINEGSYGKCYRYKDDIVLKVFFRTPFNQHKESIEKNVKNSLDVKIEGVAFPTEILKVFGYEFSYVMPYIDGTQMDEVIKKIMDENYDITFDELCKLYYDALHKMDEITDYSFLMRDFKMRNCKVTDAFSIGILDTDLYEKQKTLKNNIYNQNLRSVNDLFYDFLMNIYSNKLNIALMKHSFRYYDKILDDLNILGNIKRSDNKTYIDDALFHIDEKFKVGTVKELIFK